MLFKNIDIDDIKGIAKKAGDAIMDIYNKDFKIEYKDDRSPLTKADLKSNKIICKALNTLYPNIPIMSEENKQTDYNIRKDWEYYFCIDPIDGTKEFIKKNGEFTVNIALIHKNVPILGVVFAPAIGDMYWAKKGEGAFKNNKILPILINDNKKDRITVVTSKSHLSKDTQRFIDNLDAKKIIQVSKGSSLKLCMIAEGSADVYPRLSPTMEWDTAAADAIVKESGKMSFQYNNYNSKINLMYNKKDLLNPFFVVQ